MTVPPPPYGPDSPYGQESPYGGQPYPPAYPYPYPYPYPAQPVQPRPTNAMAIASIICAFVLAPLGIIFGHISLVQIKKSGEEGRGLAIAGLIIGYVITFVTIVIVVIMVAFLVFAAKSLDRLDGMGRYPGYSGVTTYPAPD